MKKRSYYLGLLFAAILVQVLLVWLFTPKSDGTRFVFSTNEVHLVLEFLDDDLVHVQYSTDESRPEVTQPIFTSLMVSKTDFSGPDEIFSIRRGQIDTSEIKVLVNPADLAQGIWEALITTAFGLSIAIPSYMAYNYLVSRVKTFTSDMERAASEVVNILDEQEEGYEI